jgi:GTP-binding protein
LNDPKIFFRQAQFQTSAAKVSQCPEDEGYEVAFAGRSNAGKSSALNCVTDNKGLARTSKTPGRTQLINFFQLDEQRRLVDLPGYGYAKVAEQIKLEWQKHLGRYLEVRKSLKGLVLLMDIRHPLKPQDEMILHYAIESQINTHILLTKSDKVNQQAKSQTVRNIRQTYELASDLVSVQVFSALKKQGLNELYSVLAKWYEL